MQKFASATWNGIADIVKIEDKQVPLTITNDGEGKEVIWDDTSSLSVYHRIENINYSIPVDDYGPPGTTMMEATSLKMVFMADRNKLNLRADDLSAAASMDFPKEFTEGQINTFGFNSMTISMESVNMNFINEFETEFKGVEYPLNTSLVMFSIKYKIESTYNKSCFGLCFKNC